jgi:hypothetical protein
MTAKERAKSATTTSWSLSHGHTSELTTSAASAYQPPGVATVPKRTTRGNVTSEGLMPEETAELAATRYATEVGSRFVPECSAASDGFVRARPGDGFDRLTATRTNYQVTLPGAGTEGAWQSTTFHEMRAGKHERAGRVSAPHYKARQDVPFDFDIVTGRHVEPGMVYHPEGHKKTCEKAVYSRTMTTYVDPTTGEDRPIRRAPASRSSAAAPTAPGRAPPLSTLAAVRPPTPTGTDYYKTLRR